MTPFASLIESQIDRAEDLRTRAATERQLNDARRANGIRAGIARRLHALARRLDPERGTAQPA